MRSWGFWLNAAIFLVTVVLILAEIRRGEARKAFRFFTVQSNALCAGTAMWGMVPVLYYGALYLYKIQYAPEEKRWEDFYGFNKGGHWPVSFAAMMVGTFAVCMGLMALQNL